MKETRIISVAQWYIYVSARDAFFRPCYYFKGGAQRDQNVVYSRLRTER